MDGINLDNSRLAGIALISERKWPAKQKTWAEFNSEHFRSAAHEKSMKVLWYLPTAIFGFVAVLCLLSTIERLVKGASFLAVQTLIGIVTLVLAGLCLRKERGGAPPRQ